MDPSASFRQSPYPVTYSPRDGSLFLPEMIEFNAKHNPAHTFYTFYDERVNDLRHVSHLEFYRACQRVAHAVRPNRQGPDNTIIAIIANCDTILYQALTMGVIYAGLIVRRDHLALALIGSTDFVIFKTNSRSQCRLAIHRPLWPT